MNRETKYMLLAMTLVLIACAMFTRQPFMDDSAKIVLGYFLSYVTGAPATAPLQPGFKQTI